MQLSLSGLKIIFLFSLRKAETRYKWDAFARGIGRKKECQALIIPSSRRAFCRNFAVILLNRAKKIPAKFAVIVTEKRDTYGQITGNVPVIFHRNFMVEKFPSKG